MDRAKDPRASNALYSVEFYAPMARYRPIPLLLIALLLCQLAASSLRADEASPTDAPARPEDDTAERPYWRQNLFGRFFRDQKYLFTDWWGSEFQRYQFTGPLLAGIALAAAPAGGDEANPDVEAERYLKRESREHGNAPERALSFIGNAVPAGLMIGSAYLIARIGDHDRLAEASSLSAEALLSSGLYSSVLKRLTARTRPTGGSNGRFFTYQPADGEVVGSFPSGHATGAFTVATVFAETYDDHPWVGWVAYSTAGLIGASRVAQGRHFTGDVIVGAVLGHSIGRMVTSRQRDARANSPGLEPYVDLSRQEAGVVWTKRW